MRPCCRSLGVLGVLMLLGLWLPLAGCDGSSGLPDDGSVPCTQDFECGVGEYCAQGVCQPIGGDDDQRPCTTDLQCLGDEICEGGLCVPGSRVDGGQDGEDEPPADGSDQGGEETLQPDIALAGDVIIRQDAQGTTYELNFGNVTVGQPTDANLLVRNLGQADLHLSVISLDQDPLGEFTVYPGVPPALTIPAGGESALVVTYLAVDGLTDRAVAKIYSDDPDQPELDVQLVSEFKGEAQLSLDPLLLDFGDVAVGAPATLTCLVSNTGTGNAVLQLDAMAPGVNIANAYAVALVDAISLEPVALPAYLNRGDVLEAQVTFLAPARGSYDGEIVVQCSDPDAPTANVQVRARAGAPSIEVTPARIDFGEVSTHTAAPSVPVTVRNAGVGALNLTGIDLLPGHTAEFGLTDVPALPLALQPGAEVTLEVDYTPVDVGGDATQLVIVHDDPEHAPDVRLDVGGTGVQGNARPTAVILANTEDTALLRVALNSQVGLDGRSSFDNDGTISAYEWRILQQPAAHPCGQASNLPGTVNPTTAIILRETGLTSLALRVQDNQGAWSNDDTLDVQVFSGPQADVRVGGNTTGFMETDLGTVVVFDGSYSTDCDGLVQAYDWRVVSFPAGRGSAPAIVAGGTPALSASVTFDFPGDYVLGLVVRDNDVPQNSSTEATFTVRVLGPTSFRITANWTNQGLDDNLVDVDLHLLRPGTTWAASSFTVDDCYPGKEGYDDGNPTPDWDFQGSPTYQRDSWEDADNALDPNNAADEINFPNPGLGAYGVFVYFRCHASTALGSYTCCDDMCNYGCTVFCIPCQWTGVDWCLRRAIGKVHIIITEHDGTTRTIERDFSFDAEEGWTERQIGFLSWPSGTFQ
jgi:hypothetical protein